MKIIAALDSFKGSLTSLEAGEACAAGIRSVLPSAQVRVVPVADGGEGTVEALTEALKGRFQECIVRGPLGEPVTAVYGISADGKTAVMEMSQASGLTLVPEKERNPLRTSTYGTGEMIVDALPCGCRHIIMGIGGSATVDCGTGMMSALGVRFLDAQGRGLEGCGGNLDRIMSIDASGLYEALHGCRFSVACDVSNPLTGENGAARIFGPQKGATPSIVEELENGMCNYARVLNTYAGCDVASLSGAGAAGGLGAAMTAFLGASLLPGSRLMLDTIEFDRIIEGADLIITGEGCVDRQTLMGKIPYGILRAGMALNIPVIAVGGRVENRAALIKAGFADVRSATPSDMPFAEAMRPEVAKTNVARACAEIVALNY